ncbi:hypothetical protein [Halorubrum vacuolatum]|nr:hypothetical protein [Halorubrum vacuolatum]
MDTRIRSLTSDVTDAAIWSDDSDLDERDPVETYSTSDGINSFDTR